MQMTHGAGCFIRASKPPAKKIRYKLAINLLSCQEISNKNAAWDEKILPEPELETLSHYLTSRKYRAEKPYLQPLR